MNDAIDTGGIRIECDVIFINEALLCPDCDKAKVPFAGVDNTFKKHGYFIGKKTFYLSVQSNRG